MARLCYDGPMKILFLQTGGTIDKDYPMGETHHGYNFEITTAAYERILERAKPSFSFESKTVLQKDSLDITDEERELIAQACQASPTDKIIVTHGTDTMLKTAELLSSIQGKTMVLTGALRPELFKNTDADFNLGTAVGGIGLLDHGVYIAMGGRIIPWSLAVFDPETGQFTQR